MLILKKSGGIFDPENLKNEIDNLEKKTFENDFWNRKDSKEILKNLNNKKKLLEEYDILKNSYEEVDTIIEFLEMGDNSFETELEPKISDLDKEIKNFKTKLLLNEEYDMNSAILTINAGAGGTEACDWAQMLYRMYDRWANHHKFKVEILDSLAGEEAGIKTAVYEVYGPEMYGHLKSEHGVHRLVRLSPFNADNLRQTSFSLVEVLPILDSEDDLKIDEKDLRIDTYHAGGHGGQSVNTTNSAIRITHLPTNTVVAIQNERSQLQNREKAMEILRGKLLKMQQDQQAESINQLRAGESASWGQQIRNYVMQPYKLVKDTRTKYEETDVDSVLDGKIDNFIDAYLESLVGSNN